jgi:hypothetical protein
VPAQERRPEAGRPHAEEGVLEGMQALVATVCPGLSRFSVMATWDPEAD